MRMTSDDRVVLVHDWLTGTRGGEKCLEPVCRRWPNAKLFTLLHRPGSVPESIERLRPTTSFLNRFPAVHRYYRGLLPLMPFAVNWRLPPCELVVSFSHCVAKAVRPPRGVPHVSYCFSPMRYAWHMKESYFAATGLNGLKGRLLEPFLRQLREWDRCTSDRVTHFIAISRTVQQRIRECYDRESVVIHPPVDTDFYSPAAIPRGEEYLIVSALAPYKRFDLAIEACNRLRRPLTVIGRGQQEARLRAIAGPTVRFLGWQPDEVIREHYRTAKALLFPAEEDFGIVPVEAQACGCPVIGYDRGGNRETIRPMTSPDPTGVLFEDQSVDAVIAAIETFEAQRDHFDPRTARRNALPFRTQRYEVELFGYLDEVRYGKPKPARQAA
jgi:glycosyltransferase involved in cell wall biosynthesis